MKKTYLPRLGNQSYRIEPIPAPFFNGADVGFGVQVTALPDQAGMATSSLQQSMRAIGCDRAGRIDLDNGPLFAFTMPDDPEAATMRLGWSKRDLRRESNEIDLDNYGALQKRFIRFVNSDELAQFSPEILATNLHGATVRQFAFGRSFKLGGKVHSEWQTHSDGYLKNENGRAALFLKAKTTSDWDLIARNFLGELNRNEVVKFSQNDLEAIIDIASVKDGYVMKMTELRERIEAEISYTVSRGHLTGRDIASRISTGFPNHSVKTGTKRFYAQFSTPPAVGEIAAEFLKPDGKTIFEPTIGNGVLAAASAARGGQIVGMEIDVNRFERARRAIDGSEIVVGDATKASKYPDRRFDALLANPPFKALDETLRIEMATAPTEQKSRVFPAKTQQAAILVHSINKLRGGGDAVFVMPAERNDPTLLTGEKVQIQNMLLSSFQDVQTVALDAKLYQSMGSNFPVLVHFCRNRFKDGGGRSPAQAALIAAQEFPRPTDRTFERQEDERVTLFIPSVSSFEAFYEFADHNVLDNVLESDLSLDTPKNLQEPQEPIPTANEGLAPDGGQRGGSGRAPRSQPTTSVTQGAPKGGDATPKPPPNREATPEGAEVVQEGATGPDWDTLDTESWSQPAWYIDDLSTDEFTTPYIPMSKNSRGARTVIEQTMASGTSHALQRAALNISENIDNYVAEKLGISEEAILAENGPLSPEQIDSLALSFYRKDNKKATILGDQMGVGKGRQLAAYAVNALMIENRPILFMTNRENLFTDFAIRDFADVSGKSFESLLEKGGKGTIKPFIMNANSVLKDDGRVIVSSSAADNKLARETESLSGYNLVMSSYSQVQVASGAWRASAIKNWITENSEAGLSPVLLFDEVHKAAGPDSRTGRVITDLIDHAIASGADIVYSSATSVKSGKNLPIYAPALPDTGLSNSELMLTIEKMPLAVQEILSSEMARSGSLIERKMSDAGVERNLVKLADLDPDKMQAARVASDKVSYLLQTMQAVAPEIRSAAKAQFQRMAGGAAAAASLDKLQVDTTSPATQLDAFSRYLMGSVKGMFTEELMVDAVIRNEKATIVCEYTGDSVAEWLVAKNAAGRPLVGDREVPIPAHPNMGHVLERFAERMLVVKGTDAYGERTEFKIDGFDDWLDELRHEIAGAGLEDLRVNIFDRVRHIGEQLGQKVEDISGRSIEFVEVDGEIRARRRSIPNAIDAANDFNNGRLDVLCFNNSAATGISLQNSPRHGNDLRRRVMIKMAFQREITDERQVEGRINRTGQLAPPRYVIPVTGFAADDRIANLFNRANRNLTSSTSATRDNSTNAKHTVDILNPVGELAVRSVLERRPEVAQVLAIDPAGKDLSRKLLGRSIMLPLAEQGEILGEVDTAFRLYDEKLTAEGRNPLKLGRYDWQAKVEQQRVLIDGNPNSEAIAAQPLILNKVSYKEKLAMRPPEEIERRILDGAMERSAQESFKTLEDMYGYKSAIDRGSPNLDHKLFDDVMGRSSDELRKIWRTELPNEVGRDLLGLMQNALRQNRKRGVQYNSPFTTEEVRAASEYVANALIVNKLSDTREYFAEQKTKAGNLVYDDFNYPLAIRTLYDRVGNIERMANVSELLVPGALVSLDRRAVANYMGGQFASAYEDASASNGLVPAIVTGLRFADNAPFVGSKMSISFIIPGSNHIENVTISALRTGMEVSGGGGDQPIRPFVAFANEVGSAAAVIRSNRGSETQPTLTGLRTLYGDEGILGLAKSLKGISDIRDANMDGLNLLTQGGGIDRDASAVLHAIYDGLPKQVTLRSRYTLEGNFFAGMAAISQKTGGALGEKVIYTDDQGKTRNALLLNKKGTEQIINQVSAKVAQRAIPLPKLKTAVEIGSYLSAASAILYDRANDIIADMWPENTLAEALSLGTECDLPARSATETVQGVRSLAQSVDRSFPLSLSVGGDPWAWQAEQYRRQEAKSGSRYRFLESGTSSLTFDGEVGEREGRVSPPRIVHDEVSLRLILSNITSDQMVALHSGSQIATLVFKQNNPLLKSSTSMASEMIARSTDTFRFFYSDVKLNKSVLAMEFNLKDAGERENLGLILSQAAIAHRGEILGCGMARDVNLAGSTYHSSVEAEANKKVSEILVEKSLEELKATQSAASAENLSAGKASPAPEAKTQKQPSSSRVMSGGPVR